MFASKRCIRQEFQLVPHARAVFFVVDYVAKTMLQKLAKTIFQFLMTSNSCSDQHSSQNSISNLNFLSILFEDGNFTVEWYNWSLIHLVVAHSLYIFVEYLPRILWYQKMHTFLIHIVNEMTRMRRPESTFEHHIRWSSGCNSLSSFIWTSIGWHHCRTRNPIGPRN